LQARSGGWEGSESGCIWFLVILIFYNFDHLSGFSEIPMMVGKSVNGGWDGPVRKFGKPTGN